MKLFGNNRFYKEKIIFYYTYISKYSYAAYICFFLIYIPLILILYYKTKLTKKLIIIFSGTFLAASFAAPAVYDYSSQGSNWASGVCASGQGQSPIDIDDSTTTPVSTEYDQFTLTNYEKPHKWTVKNTGHGVKLEPAVEDMKFTGGDFSEEYTLAQLHFHWGDLSGYATRTHQGSEHTFNGNRFFSEVHFVHYKSSHADLSAAVASGAQDDLAVLGFFLEIDFLGDEGPFDYLITDIIADKVKTYNNVTETKETVFWSPNHLVDVENIKTAPFYRYEGKRKFL